MNRRLTSVLSALAVAGAIPALAAQGPTHAAPPLQDLSHTSAQKQDDHPDGLADKRNALRQRAVDALVTGRATYAGRGSNRTIKLHDGTRVDYPVSQTAQLLTFLVDFGDGTGNAAFPDDTAGPVHNQMPKPGADDNSTYWTRTSPAEHYMDMFHVRQDGESFKDFYLKHVQRPLPRQGRRLRLGQGALQRGPLRSRPVTQDADGYWTYHQRHGATPGTTPRRRRQDDAADQGLPRSSSTRSTATTTTTTATSTSRDGYIDHFQAIHAGEGEEAGGGAQGADAIWSHRWYAYSNDAGKTGPTGNKLGGVQIGDTGIWIGDYTTEPENGGLGVFCPRVRPRPRPARPLRHRGGDNGTGFWTLMSGRLVAEPRRATRSAPRRATWAPGEAPPRLARLQRPRGRRRHQRHAPSGRSARRTTRRRRGAGRGRHAAAGQVHGRRGPARAGTHYFYSGNSDSRDATLTSPEVTVPADNPTLTARVSYSIENDWDYAFTKVSTDGGATWSYVRNNRPPPPTRTSRTRATASPAAPAPVTPRACATTPGPTCRSTSRSTSARRC